MFVDTTTPPFQRRTLLDLFSMQENEFEVDSSRIDSSEVSTMSKDYDSHTLRWEIEKACAKWVDIDELSNIILCFRNAHRYSGSFVFDRIDWSYNLYISKITTSSVSSISHPISDETNEFLKNQSLQSSITWLMMVASHFFPGANFEIDLLPDEDEENPILALRVYSSFDSNEFRERRHKICQAMLSARHNRLYDVLSIFQRGINRSGWQAFSYISKFFTE